MNTNKNEQSLYNITVLLIKVNINTNKTDQSLYNITVINKSEYEHQ